MTNNCEYCIHSHAAAARTKGMTPRMFDELIAVTALANATNRLANGYRIDVDERYRLAARAVNAFAYAGGACATAT